jgi:predicted ester cyclase
MSALPDTLPASIRERNINLFELYIEFENARDYENMEKILHPTEFCSKTYFGLDPIHPKAHTRMLRGLFRAFPDWYMTIDEIMIETDEVIVGRITGRGTQHEEYFSRPPRDHQVAIPTIHAIKIKDRFIVEHRHTNPFEDVFKADIMTPLNSDVQAVRARQGYDSEAAAKALHTALKAGADPAQLAELEERVRLGRRQCQVLLRDTLRRCAMPALAHSIYCRHHRHHGYGIDGIPDAPELDENFEKSLGLLEAA